MKIAGLIPIFLVLLLLPGLLKSQETVGFSGIVTDSATGNPLPFAQLSVQKSAIGTVSNEEGHFNLDVPSAFAKDTLLVAYMGYETIKVAIHGLPVNDIRVAMKPGTLQLAEVEILALSAEEVIRRVVANIPINYGTDSLILTAFVRSQKFVGGKLAEYTEAIIEDLKTGYNHYKPGDAKEKARESNVPFLLKGRVISDTLLVNSIGDLGKSAGCLGCNFVHDFAEFYRQTVLDEELFRYYTFSMEELIKPEGGKIYHLRFDQKKGVKQTLWRGEMFVNSADFALLKIIQKPSFEAFDQYEKKKYNKPYTILNKPGWIEEMPMMEWTTTYATRNGKYYLSTIRVQNWLTFNNPASGQKLKYAFKNEVVITDATRDKEKIRNFKGDKSIGVNQRWDQLAGASDDRFWSTFNYLPIENKLQESINKLTH
ncbi:MAG: carboxypeptidase-like regulatory domain-containing protein [Bacteroidales bacterium]